MTSNNIKISLLFGAAVLLAASAASAGTGCNGVVSPAEWGCAPWDNNNGPQYPHYQKTNAPAASTSYAAGAMAPNRNLVAQGGGNLVAQGGGNLVAQGGGNLVAQGGGNLVAQGGGNLRH